MNMQMRSTLGWTLVVCGGLFAQANEAAAGPWLEESDRLPPFPQRVVFIQSIERDQIKAFEPLIVRVTMTNWDSTPLIIKTRKDGAPFMLASLVARGDGPFERHHQWLMREAPEYVGLFDPRATLKSGESTSGEFLILFGGRPTGLPFSEPGQYRIKVACQPEGKYAPVYSNEMLINVLPEDGTNAAFLRDLDELTYQHNGNDREAMVRIVGPRYHVGLEMLQRIIGQSHPHLIAPDENPADRKELKLVEALTELLERHPNSAYSGYIARFLGLVHIKTFEHNVSFEEGRKRRETGKPPKHDAEAMKARPEYQDALRYLTLAEESDLWPRTTAIRYLGLLHVMTQEWDKVTSCLDTLRTKYKDSNGTKVAKELEDEVNAYKAKLVERRESKGE